MSSLSIHSFNQYTREQPANSLIYFSGLKLEFVLSIYLRQFLAINIAMFNRGKLYILSIKFCAFLCSANDFLHNCLFDDILITRAESFAIFPITTTESIKGITIIFI